MGRHKIPPTANPVCPQGKIALNSCGCRVVLHRVASVGGCTVGLSSEKPGMLGFQHPLGAIATGLAQTCPATGKVPLVAG